MIFISWYFLVELFGFIIRWYFFRNIFGGVYFVVFVGDFLVVFLVVFSWLVVF